jgi:hypothetical protein
MNRFAPLATLMSVVLLGVGLVVANMFTAPGRAAPPAAAPAAAAATAGQAAPGKAAPPPAAAPVPTAPVQVDPTAPVVGEKAYTGRSAGNEVTVAVAVKNGKAAAYVCNGKKIEAWMDGTLTGERLSLRGRNGSLTATVNITATLGTVTVDGVEWPFSAKGVAAPAGLYQGRGVLRGVAARVGWIVEDNGTVTGTVNRGGAVAPAPPIGSRPPASVAVGGDTLTVTRVGGDTSVVQR